MKRKVVITGLGAITPLGNSVSEFWDGLIHGKNGIAPITRFDASRLTSRMGGEVKDFEPLKYMDNKEVHSLRR